MIAYQVRLALKSLKRNPVLSGLLVGGIALGIAVSMVFVTAYYHLSGNPIPDKSDRLFYVQMDSWDPERPWDGDNPSEPPDQLTYTDALAVKASTIPSHSCISFKANLTIHPDAEGLRPYRDDVRMTSGDFFPMFEVPFRYGGGWDAAADHLSEAGDKHHQSAHAPSPSWCWMPRRIRSSSEARTAWGARSASRTRTSGSSA